MADYALVKEKMIELGEDLHAMGYDGVQEMIEGNGPVADCCNRCDSAPKSKLLSEYLKDLHQTFKTRNPDPEGRKEDAVRAVTAAWNEVRQALSDDPDVEFEQVSSPPPPGRGVNAAPRVGGPAQVRVAVNAATRGPSVARPMPQAVRAHNAATRGPTVPAGFSPPRRRP